MAMTLKAARVNAGFTQREAARLLQVGRNALSSWEQGKSAPRETQIRKIEELYGVSYNDLIFLPKNTLKA